MGLLLNMKTVLIDSREPMEMGSELSLKLPSSTQVESAFMQFGDVVWFTDGPSFGFEFKSTSDLIGSLWRRDRGERLERQLTGLRATYDNAFLGIHGLLVPHESGLLICKEPGKGHDTVISKVQAKTRISAKQLEGFLFSIEHPDTGNPVKVIWRPTKDALLEAVAAIYNSSQKTGGHSTFNHVLTTAKPHIQTEKDQWIAMYISIKGIGETTAKKLVEEFGPPATLMKSLQQPSRTTFGTNHTHHQSTGKTCLTPSVKKALITGFGLS